MQSSPAKVDEESKQFLLEVKKGKPRKFVIIKEGVQIDRLYVFKKGPYQRFIRMAKQEGVRGEAFWGVVRGDGLDIHFELSRTDGFDRPPGPNIRLKEFLKEHTGFKFEPDYVIVDALSAIEDEGEEGNEGGQVGQAETEDVGQKFTRLLKAILPHVKRALAVTTSVSDELRQCVDEARELGRQREFEQGLVILRRVGELAKQALAEAESTAPADSESTRLNARLGELQSLAEQVGASDTSHGRNLAARIQEVERLIVSEQFDRAEKLLRQAEQLIELARAEIARRQQWEDRAAELTQRYQDALRVGAAETNKLRAIMDYAQAQAERKQYVKALVALDRLAPLLIGGDGG